MLFLRKARFEAQTTRMVSEPLEQNLTVRGFLEEESYKGNAGGVVTYLATLPADREMIGDFADYAKFGYQKLRIFAWYKQTAEYLRFYLGHEVVVEGKLTFYPFMEPPSALQVSLEADSIMERAPGEVAHSFHPNETNRKRGEELKASLASKVLQNGSIKVCVIGPDKKGVGDFREEFGAKMTKPDSVLAKYVNCQIKDISLMPREHATQEETAAFYENLGDLVTKLAESPEKFDLLCLMRGGGSADDLTRLNHVAICKAVIQSPVTVVMAIGHFGDKSLWLKRCAEHSITCPGTFAGFLEEVATQAESLIRSQSAHSKKDTAKTLLILYGIAAAILLLAYCAVHYSANF